MQSFREPPRSSGAHGRALLVLVLACAAALRFWGLRQGIPFALGVDEPEVMDRALRMVRTGDFNPHFYDYPTLYMYMQAAVAVVRFVSGAMRAEWTSLAEAPTAAFYLWGRALTAVLGTLTVAVVFAAGLRQGRMAAAAGAALLAVMPLHVRESHYVLTDVPMTFFVALTFLCTLRASERPTLARFAAAGAVAGLAAATKYNGGLALLMPLAACVAAGDRRVIARFALATIAACAGAYLLAAPYTFLDLPGFLNGFGRLANMYRTNPTGAEPIPVTYLKHLRIALDWTGSAVVAAGLLLAIWRIAAGPERLRWTLAAGFPLVYFVFISRQHIVYARYLLPTLPFLALLAGAFVDDALARLRERHAPARVRAAVAVLLLLMALVPPSVTAIGFGRNATKTWTTEQAYRWIEANVPRGSSIVIESRAIVFDGEYKARNVPQLRLTPDVTAPEYLVASSQVYGQYFAEPANYPSEYADYVRIFRQAQEVARFVPTDEHPGPELRVLKVVR